jgi:hypothetical protein
LFDVTKAISIPEKKAEKIIARIITTIEFMFQKIPPKSPSLSGEGD